MYVYPPAVPPFTMGGGAVWQTAHTGRVKGLTDLSNEPTTSKLPSATSKLTSNLPGANTRASAPDHGGQKVMARRISNVSPLNNKKQNKTQLQSSEV